MRAQCTQIMTRTQRTVAQAIAIGRVRRAQKGQSLVELALVLPIFVLLLMAAGEFGIALREQTSLTQVLQQAAHYLADHPATSGCPSGAAGWSTSMTCNQYLQDFPT